MPFKFDEKHTHFFQLCSLASPREGLVPFLAEQKPKNLQRVLVLVMGHIDCKVGKDGVVYSEGDVTIDVENDVCNPILEASVLYSGNDTETIDFWLLGFGLKKLQSYLVKLGEEVDCTSSKPNESPSDQPQCAFHYIPFFRVCCWTQDKFFSTVAVECSTLPSIDPGQLGLNEPADQLHEEQAKQASAAASCVQKPRKETKKFRAQARHFLQTFITSESDTVAISGGSWVGLQTQQKVLVPGAQSSSHFQLHLHLNPSPRGPEFSTLRLRTSSKVAKGVHEARSIEAYIDEVEVRQLITKVEEVLKDNHCTLSRNLNLGKLAMVVEIRPTRAEQRRKQKSW
eukprot:m.54406 g.54406  ORF g.54406 m.54406 type:complete len:341 (-) comp11415_c1_seq1:202-1224(-)